MSSLALITRYLGASAQQDLALQLSSKLDEDEDNLDALYELLEGLELKDEVCDNILTYLSHCVFEQRNEAKYKRIAEFLARLDRLYDEIVSQCRKILRTYAKLNVKLFTEEFQDAILKWNDELPEEVTTEYIGQLFEFLDQLFQSTDKNDDIDLEILLFLGLSDNTLSTKASKLLRWRMASIVDKTKDTSIMWDVIFTLEKSDKTHKTHSLVTWLRYLSNSEVTSSEVYQKLIQDTAYWTVLQGFLVSNSHDHKKYCLSILQLSIKAIDCTFSNALLQWDNSKKNLYLKEWARYVTLFEILAIDTSLHQAQAALNDIVALVSPKSLIHASWGFCLISTGFTASMDSVRKFSLKLLLSIPHENLYMLKYGLDLLVDVFLPYAMIASHYILRVSDDGIETCEFGTRISAFTEGLVGNLQSDSEAQEVAAAVLQVLDNTRESFDPARIYVTAGLLNGLRKRQILQYGKHDVALVRLFEMESEGVVYETSLQTLNLRLLLAFEPDSNHFLECLQKFVTINGTSLVIEHRAQITEYLTACGVVTGPNESLAKIILGEEVDADLSLLKLNIPVDANSVQKYQHRLRNLSDSDFEALTNVDFKVFYDCVPADFNYSGLWESLVQDVQLSDYYTLVGAHHKHQVFNNLYEHFECLDSFDAIQDFHSKVFANADELKTVPAYYKLRNEIMGQFYRTLEIFSRKTGLGANFPRALNMMTPNSVHFVSNTHMVRAVSIYLDQGVEVQCLEQVCELLGELWQGLDSVRLQLNQKTLHLLIIDTFTHPSILTASISTPAIATTLLDFYNSVIRNTPGRRSLLPRLSKRLLEYQNQSSDFEKMTFLPEVLVKGYICYQLHANAFKLEPIMGEFFRREIGGYDLYNKVHGPAEVAARVNFLASLNSIKSPQFAYAVLQYLIDSAEEYELFKVLKPTDGFLEWRRIQLYSVIVSIMDKIIVDGKMDDKMEGDKTFSIDMFCNLVETEPSPLARVYVEWIVAYSIARRKDYGIRLLKQLLDKQATLRPAVVVSYQRILFLMAKQYTGVEEKELLEQFLTALIPAATSNKAIVRHFALSLTVSMYEEISGKKLVLEDKLMKTLENMYKAAVASDSFGQYRSGDALLWDVVDDLDLVSIAGGVLMRLSDRDDIEFIPEADFTKHLSQHSVLQLNHPIGDDRKSLWVKNRKQQGVKKAAPSAKESAPLQTKSGAWNTIMDVDHASRVGEVVRSDLIVVSSLVDKPPNLGGICRLCDVLGAGLLTLNDINVKNNQQFKTVAVTADQWMPMIEVKVDAIKDYLIEKKKEGYTLVGLEQTDGSVELNSDLKLPKKSLILIGKEKEGVPGDLLAELDICVEIKQVGVIRSMNIQTATAILVHAYSTQHC